ncbi:MAG TPA: HAD-IC family P-type ATPase [Pyrinomonadaceae bacterium]
MKRPSSSATSDPEFRTAPHSESAEALLQNLGVTKNHGLSATEAAGKLERFGSNALVRQLTRPAWRSFLAQFSSVVIWLLAAAAAVSAITGSLVESLAIVIVLLINAIIGFAIEWQSGRALEALRHSSRTTARVRRDGRDRTIDASELVVGDVILLTAGDHVPADSRLLEIANLRVDESSLTGESTPVDKSVTPVPERTPLAERISMAFLGTHVVAGHALAVVTGTGGNTEIGKVGRLLEQASDQKTPLERRLADLGKRLVYLVLGISLVVLVAGFVRGDDPWLVTKISISLAVAAVPEGLPAVTTLILALGVLRMARASAIVRHLAAVETLGSTTVICTDKTGTLTENRMTVREVFLSDGRSVDLAAESAGAGERLDPDDDAHLTRLLLVAVLCSEATFHAPENEFFGDPTETALLAIASDLGVDVERSRKLNRKISEIPFEAATKKMTAVFEMDNSTCRAMMKGAPSVVLEACDRYLDDTGIAEPLGRTKRESFRQINDVLAAKGLRILAFADKVCDIESAGSDADSDFTFLGFVGMTDPPRPEVPDAIRRAKDAGIRVVMLTGDQLVTARAIARELHLSSDNDISALHSRDLTDVDAPKVAELARTADVFARVTPEDKLRIVRALQNAGEIVAVTGDGVNDAPALKQADIGIAMGMRGTEVAKESADIVLTDDNFSTIVHAVEGGRTIYANIIKFVHLMFSHNLGEILVIFVAIIVGLPLPLFPLQILWINLVTDIFPAFALAVEPATKHTMLRRPRSPGESFLSLRFMFLIAWQGAMLAAITLAAYVWALNEYGEGSHARTVALFALIGVQIGHLFNCRSRTRSAFHAFFSNPFIFVSVAIVVALQAYAVIDPFLSNILQLDKPNARDYIVLGIATALPLAVVEISKVFGHRAVSPVNN